MTHIKVCGLTSLEDAEACAERGVSALGLNFWPRSVRCCPPDVARAIVASLAERVRLVAVTVDATADHLRELRDELGIPWHQLHGDESASDLERWLPHAMKAARVGSADDVPTARLFGGPELLVDARVPGMPGGTGVRCDWQSAASLAKERPLWLAGGLTPTNVEAAIEAVRPHGVDLASGVESAPGVKDLAAVERLVAAVRAADSAPR